MTWVKMDDQMVDNRKIDRLSDRAFRLYVAGLCFCGAQLTDGFLLAKDVKVICAKVRATRKHVDELFEGELWLPAGGGGFQVKDFLVYNPTRERVMEERRKARERMERLRSSGERSGEQPAELNAVRSASPSSSRKGLRPLSGDLQSVMNQARKAALDRGEAA